MNNIDLYIVIISFKKVESESEEIFAISSKEEDNEKLKYSKIYIIYSTDEKSACDRLLNCLTEEIVAIEATKLKRRNIIEALPKEFLEVPVDGRCYCTEEELLLNPDNFSFPILFDYIETIILG